MRNSSAGRRLISSLNQSRVDRNSEADDSSSSAFSAARVGCPVLESLASGREGLWRAIRCHLWYTGNRFTLKPAPPSQYGGAITVLFGSQDPGHVLIAPNKLAFPSDIRNPKRNWNSLRANYLLSHCFPGTLARWPDF